MAIALDHIGDRWTLLIIRDLLAGPARFNDLAAGLDGVAPNLLSNRLRRLTDSRIVEVRPVFGASAYALTDLGEGLRPAVKSLGMWGVAAGPLKGTDQAPIARARSAAFALETMLSMATPPIEPTRIGVQVGDELLVVSLGGPGAPAVRAALDERTDSVVITTLDVLSALPINGLPEPSLRPATSDAADSDAVATLSNMAAEALQRMAINSEK